MRLLNSSTQDPAAKVSLCAPPEHSGSHLTFRTLSINSGFISSAKSLAKVLTVMTPISLQMKNGTRSESSITSYFQPASFLSIIQHTMSAATVIQSTPALTPTLCSGLLRLALGFTRIGMPKFLGFIMLTFQQPTLRPRGIPLNAWNSCGSGGLALSPDTNLVPRLATSQKSVLLRTTTRTHSGFWTQNSSSRVLILSQTSTQGGQAT